MNAPSEKPPERWKALVVCSNAEVSRRLGQVLSELGGVEVCQISEYPRMHTMTALVSQHGCNLCFLDFHNNQEHALVLLSEASTVLPVVVLSPPRDADLILRALRSGAAEFLPDPSLDQVKAILERLRSKNNATETAKLGTVYCVVPGKAGSGASTLSVQLACELHRRGVAKVLLVDLDTLSGSVAFQLKLKSDFHVGDAIRDAGRLDSDLWERLTATSDGIDVLLSPADPSVTVEMVRSHTTELLGFLRPRYDAIILDLPDARAATETGSAFLAQKVLLVTTNELGVLHSTRRAIEFLEHQGMERAQLRLVINRYSTRQGLKREDVQAALQLEPFAVINADQDAIQNAILSGKAATQDTAFSRSVESLALKIHEIPQPIPIKRSAGWLSLFGQRK